MRFDKSLILELGRQNEWHNVADTHRSLPALSNSDSDPIWNAHERRLGSVFIIPQTKSVLVIYFMLFLLSPENDKFTCARRLQICVPFHVSHKYIYTCNICVSCKVLHNVNGWPPKWAPRVLTGSGAGHFSDYRIQTMQISHCQPGTNKIHGLWNGRYALTNE